MKGEDMALLDRIANYFKEWDGIDETAPKMELSIHDLRYIADMNVERCRLIRQLNEANLKTEEIRNKAIDDFVEKSIKIVYEANNRDRNPQPRDMVADIHYKFIELAEQMKAGGENEND